MSAPSGLASFADSVAGYEAWMRRQLGGWVVEKALDHKHARMREHPFLFLRATCWRWAEAAPALCPELADAPIAPSVGDAHAGNFGIWRDAESRLVWGINDYDEAARLPWCLDLVRLCASIALAIPEWNPRATAASALDGYRAGLKAPRPMVLEREHLWLRDAFAAKDKQREEYWQEIEDAKPAPRIPKPLRAALLAALPEPGIDVRIATREAGAGSLGRPRYVAFCKEHRGGPVAVEVKGTLPSCWAAGREAGLAGRMAAGRFRSHDPMLHYGERFVVRRLAPNSRKLKLEEVGAVTLRQLVGAMGAELAAVHAETDALQRAIRTDLKARGKDWLEAAADTVARWTVAEHEQYRKRRPG